jgi:hypothetical protein
MKRKYDSITPWALPEKLKNKTVRILPVVEPPLTQIDIDDFYMRERQEEQEVKFNLEETE